MKYLAAFFTLIFSASLSARVITLECVPNQPDKEEAKLHEFVVDMENKTWEWGDIIFDDVSVSGNTVTAEGVSARGFGWQIVETFSLSRIDLTYIRRKKKGVFKGTYEGQCEIAEGVERAF